MSNTITAQFIRHDLPGFAAIIPYQPFEEALSRSSVPLSLKADINHLAILINSAPQVVLLTIDLHEHFVEVECIAVASVFPLQSSSVYRTKLDAPQANCLSADGNTSLCQKVLDIAVTEVEAVVKPDSIADDVPRESVTLISIHPPILTMGPVKLSIPPPEVGRLGIVVC